MPRPFGHDCACSSTMFHPVCMVYGVERFLEIKHLPERLGGSVGIRHSAIQHSAVRLYWQATVLRLLPHASEKIPPSPSISDLPGTRFVFSVLTLYFS